jgi:hypothetical protein
MEKETPQSTRVKRMKYLPELMYLYITYDDGRVIKYRHVPMDVAEGLFNAKSVGNYLRLNVNHKYQYTRIKPVRKFFIFDDMYRKDKLRAVMHEMCDHNQQALKHCKKYKTGTVIVEGVLENGQIKNARILDKNKIIKDGNKRIRTPRKKN